MASPWEKAKEEYYKKYGKYPLNWREKNKGLIPKNKIVEWINNPKGGNKIPREFALLGAKRAGKCRSREIALGAPDIN